MTEKSTHRVEVVRIHAIEKHPNADSLGIVRVYGYTCCVRLGDFQPGDLAAYIVPDSIVPETEAFAFLGEHRRIRVKRLRGTVSQGLLIKAPDGSKDGDDVAEMLGVTRYESPISAQSGGEAESGPFSVPKYDLESWHRYGMALVPGEEVVVTEKIHGASARFAWTEDRLWCGSRVEWKRQSDENLWWQAARHNSWIEEFCRTNPELILYGEVFGRVQELRYGVLPGGAPRFLAFDLLNPRGLEWIQWREFSNLLAPEFRVPVLYEGSYDPEDVVVISRGLSCVPLATHLKEGAVVQPVIERRHDECGRVKLKIVSDEYLERS